MFAGGLQLPAAEIERTAGSSHCLWGKLIPEKMHTPTYWPKMRRVTSIRFSVSCLKAPCITLTTFRPLVMRLFFSFKLLFQSIMSSQSAWMHTTNSGECFVIWCCEPLVQRKLYHKWEEDQGLDTACKNNPVYSCKVMYGLVWLLSSTNQTCSYLRWLEPMDFKHNTCSFKLNVMWTAGRTAFNYLASRLPQWGCVALHPRW